MQVPFHAESYRVLDRGCSGSTGRSCSLIPTAPIAALPRQNARSGPAATLPTGPTIRAFLTPERAFLWAFEIDLGGGWG